MAEMSPPQPSKRRRLASANHTLTQPFKSPLKTQLKHIPAIPLTSPLTSTRDPSSKEKYSTPTAPAATPTGLQHPPSPPLRRSVLSKTTTTTPAHSTHLTTLQNKHTRLLAALATARASLETHTQALRIESRATSSSTNTDTDLVKLIQTWKIVSRAAAEELFGGVRDRVNRMGGVGAWRAREKEKNERFYGSGGESAWGWGWEGEGGKSGGQGEEEGEGEERDERECGGDEIDERNDDRKEAEDADDEERGFTMDMMLRSLNVELGVIGYDKEAGRWID